MKNPEFEYSFYNFNPQLTDKTAITSIEPVYFYQDTWAARKIFEIKPSHIIDVGSNVKTIGILSQFVPVTMIDIREVNVVLPNFNFKMGSILNLPFENNSIEFISSLCVVEHIGLGRYGDDIDAFGSEKAIAELIRVVKPGGYLLFSVPIDNQNKIYFNAHRAFTRSYVLKLFDGFSLADELYQYKWETFKEYDPNKGFGTGMFLFQKIQP